MYCEALHRNGELLVSAEWFCRAIYNLHVSTYDDVVYVTDHFSSLAMNTADVIRELLQGKPVPEGYESWM
jgi:hypothetical protein